MLEIRPANTLTVPSFASRTVNLDVDLGALAIRYVFSTTITDSDPGNGRLRLSATQQDAALTVRADTLDINGSDVSGILDAFDDSTSATKGSLRIYKVSDPTKWLVFDVTALASPTGYRNLTVENVAASDTSPFEDGDTVLLSFQPAGQKGETGDPGADAAGAVATRAELAALPASGAAYLTETGREGQFVWRSGDYSAEVAADTRQGIYVASSTVADTVGCWVRAWSLSVEPDWFKLTSDTGDSPCIAAAFALAHTLQRPVVATRMYTCTSQIALPGAAGSGGSEGYSLVLSGLGESTGFYHDFDGALFNCVVTQPAVLRAENFKVISRSPKTTAAATTFMFDGGLVKSLFRTIRLGFDGVAGNEPQGLFDSDPDSTTDTIVFDDCHLEGIRGNGYGIAKGSSIWFRGGRIIGRGDAASLNAQVSHGVKLYGGNGGVWFNDIDIINCYIAVHVTKQNGTTNREIFLNGGVIDSSYIGFAAEDSSYIEWDGIWASACGVANILFTETFSGIFKGTGGTIFNGGAVTAGGGAGDGITINGGEMYLTGVLVRDCAGRGVRCPSTAPSRGNMTGCTVRDNDIGFDAGGTWAGSGNDITGNSTNIIRNTANLARFVAAESRGSGSYTTDANGEFLVAHGLGTSPIYASASSFGDIAGESCIVSFDATNIRIRVRVTTTNADAASTNVDVMWHALA